MEFKAYKITDLDDIRVPVDYDSPINIIFQKAEEQIEKRMEELDNNVFAEFQKYCVNIDKEKLVSILQQDNKRYRDAYTKGYLDGMKKVSEAFNRAMAEATGQEYTDE